MKKDPALSSAKLAPLTQGEHRELSLLEKRDKAHLELSFGLGHPNSYYSAVRTITRGFGNWLSHLRMPLQHGTSTAGFLAGDSQDHAKSTGHSRISVIVTERTDGAWHPRAQAVT